MDRPDFTTIYTEYRSRVLGYIYARLRSMADAEDLCEDVFEKVQARLGGYDPQKASLSTWIYTITRNCVIDRYRKQRPQSELDENIREDSEVDERLLNDETLGELADALSQLPAQLREIIVLRYYENKPLTDVAQTLGLSYGAIKLRHAKALDMLRNSMHLSL